ncbi:MAG: flagellar motor switch protein FliN, partial [Micrococcales bacterium]|nr:flagellar motor switch protein FliN [Micrococcales bacterium]
MSTTEQDVDAALLAAAQALPPHFTGGADLTLQTLDAIQATTMSLPGGAFAVESVLKEAGNVGPVQLIVTGLVDHANGEVFSRDEARTLWTAALTDSLEVLKGRLGDFTAGQIHMTDAFDVLDSSDEANVVGIFTGQILAGMLLAQPAVATGEGAAALLAGEVAAA